MESLGALPVRKSRKVDEISVLEAQIEDDLGFGVVDEELAVSDPVRAGLVLLPGLIDRAEMPVESPFGVEKPAVEDAAASRSPPLWFAVRARERIA